MLWLFGPFEFGGGWYVLRNSSSFLARNLNALTTLFWWVWKYVSNSLMTFCRLGGISCLMSHLVSCRENEVEIDSVQHLQKYFWSSRATTNHLIICARGRKYIGTWVLGIFHLVNQCFWLLVYLSFVKIKLSLAKNRHKNGQNFPKT